jgi:hypothetical protein
LTNGIRVNIDDIVKCRSLEYRSPHGDRDRSRITPRSATITDRLRERMVGDEHDPYNAERYVDPSAPINRARTIDQLREREEDMRDRREQREEEREIRREERENDRRRADWDHDVHDEKPDKEI